MKPIFVFLFLLSSIDFYGQNVDSLQKKFNRFSISLEVGKMLSIFESEKIFETHSGNGFGMAFRFPRKSIFSLGTSFSFYQIKGQEPQPFNTFSPELNIGLIEPMFTDYIMDNGHPDGIWFPSYKHNLISGNIALNLSFINMINYFFDKDLNWDLYINYGLGRMIKNTYLNLYDETEIAYKGLVDQVGFTSDKFNTVNGRKELRNAVLDFYDNSYETESNLNSLKYFETTYSINLTRKMYKNIDLGISYKVTSYKNNDELEKIPDRTFNYFATRDDKFEILNVLITYNF